MFILVITTKTQITIHDQNRYKIQKRFIQEEFQHQNNSKRVIISALILTYTNIQLIELHSRQQGSRFKNNSQNKKNKEHNFILHPEF